MATKTEKQKQAQKRYMAKVARFGITVPPDFAKKIREAASAAGLSVNAFIRRAIAEQMDRDKETADCKRYMEMPNDTIYEMLRRGLKVDNMQDMSVEEKAAFAEKLEKYIWNGTQW